MPAYMGLIKQIDDQMGVLFRFLDERGLMDKTMIVFTSDHGDYLGDHWMGEKDLFHEPRVRVPLIIYDPDSARRRHARQGTTRSSKRSTSRRLSSTRTVARRCRTSWTAARCGRCCSARRRRNGDAMP